MLAFLLACSMDVTPIPKPEPVVAAPVVAAPGLVAVDPIGAAVWKQHCVSCHGEGGKGDGPAAAGLVPPPKDLSRPRLPEDRHPPSRIDVLHHGSAGTAMVAFEAKLTPRELAAVTRYVQTLAHGAALTPR